MIVNSLLEKFKSHCCFSGKTKLLIAINLIPGTHQNSTDEEHLKHCGSEIEDKSTEDKGDAPCAAVNGLGQSPCLAAEMETQIQIVQV